jgi:CRP-like cAMP-binding protein
MEENFQAVKEIAAIHHVTLSEKSVNELVTIVEKKEYRREHVFFKQGQINYYFYYIQRGMIRQFYYKKGKDVTEHFSHEGNMAVNIESLYHNQPSHLYMETIEDSVIYFILYSKLEKLCRQYPDISLLYERIIEKLLIISQQKADSWRFETAHERYERFCKDYPEEVKRAPGSYIASYLLMTPESLSRVRSGRL